jgi:hypothetical protein
VTAVLFAMLANSLLYFLCYSLYIVGGTTIIVCIRTEVVAFGFRGTHSSCSTPARLSSIKYNYGLPLRPRILTQISCSRRPSYAASHDNDISFFRQLLCRAMPKQELIWLAMPKRVRRVRRRDRGASVSHDVDREG